MAGQFRRRSAHHLAVAFAFAGILGGCATASHSPAVAIAKSDAIAILPIVNTTETPQAGTRAEVMLESLLQADGYSHLARQQVPQRDTLFQVTTQSDVDQAVAAARGNAKYGITGAVQEWRYKVGVDGEPAVGITLRLIDLDSGAVVWTGTASRTGWSRTSVSGLAQKVIGGLISDMAR